VKRPKIFAAFALIFVIHAHKNVQIMKQNIVKSVRMHANNVLMNAEQWLDYFKRMQVFFPAFLLLFNFKTNKLWKIINKKAAWE
jgi:hypothetical protein